MSLGAFKEIEGKWYCLNMRGRKEPLIVYVHPSEICNGEDIFTLIYAYYPPTKNWMWKRMKQPIDTTDWEPIKNENYIKELYKELVKLLLRN